MICKLGTLASIKGGKRLPKGKSLITTPNSHPYIRVGDLNSQRTLELTSNYEFVDDETQKQIERYIVQKGNIILSIVGTIGLVAMVGESLDNANLTENCVKIVASDAIDCKFLYYYLKSSKGQSEIARGTVGAVQAKLPIKNIQDIDVWLPQKDIQVKIASILSYIDDKIELNNRINENLERQAYAFYQYLFVENANPEWKQGTISDLGAVVGGSTPSKSKPEYYTDNGTAWITPKDLSVNKSKFISHGENDITELGLKNSSANIMPEGTVLFSSRAPIGYIAIAAGEVTTNQGFKSVVPKLEIGTAFVYYFLKHNLSIIEGMASGSTFKEVSGSTMKNIPAIIPDPEILIRFRDFCKPIFKQQQILEKQNQLLVSLRDGLLPQLMSGKIDVCEITL